MHKFSFDVEFLSDVVLNATSNTEGKISQLDFIPGSVFLGITAHNYTKFKNSFDIFHSGKVRFGDAHIVFQGKKTYKMPLSYFHEKGEEESCYNFHLINNFQDFTQLKQKRNGYITEDYRTLYMDFRYNQKSAYDTQKRRNKESSMYGYNAIKKGTRWRFSVNIDETIPQEDTTLIKETLIGTHHIGKSKTAEYGLVKISAASEDDTSNTNVSPDGSEVVLYANSRLALTDSTGHPTLELTALCEGLKAENICIDKTQIRTSTFTPYNSTRKQYDQERVCINKGSVIVLQHISQKQLTEIQTGVGAYLSEGFGDIIINPDFLLQKEINLSDVSSPMEQVRIQKPVTSLTAKFLFNRKTEKEKLLQLATDVAQFKKRYKNLFSNIQPSQWGAIRAICNSNMENKKKAIQKQISGGIKAWTRQQQQLLLEHDVEFIKLLAIQMPKGNK